VLPGNQFGDKFGDKFAAELLAGNKMRIAALLASSSALGRGIAEGLKKWT